MSVNVDASELTIHDSIEISGDSDFTAPNGVSSGSGTEGDPYIIEGWEIDGTITGYGIKIDSTTKYCTIQNCELYGGTGAGIYLDDATNITINVCELYDNDIGIYLEQTHDNLITNCTSYENEITGVIIDNCNNITLTNNDYYNEYTNGIYMESSEDCLIYNNSINECGSNGIYINSGSSQITISNNYITNSSTNGIYIDASNNITIIENMITENENIGIVLNGLTTTDCIIYHNTISNNANKQAQEETNDGNQWDNGEEGNWWGDYTGVDYLLPFGIGDTPYNITNGGGAWTNHDRYPLVEFNPMNILLHILLSLIALLILMAVMRELFQMSKREIEGDK